MWPRIKRILAIILVFILFSLLISFLWFLFEQSVLKNTSTSEYNDYVLFWLGYGDVQNANSSLKVFISISGVVAVAFMSSVTTFCLIEARKRIYISKNIIVCMDNSEQYLGYKHYGVFLIYNKHSDIYKLSISLQLMNSRTSICQDYSIPYITKGERYIISSNIDAGSIIFAHQQDEVEYNESSVIILTASYTDSRNLQEYILCRKYECCHEKNNYIANGSDFCLADKDILKIGTKKDSKLYKELSSLLNDTKYDEEIRKMILDPGYIISLKDAKAVSAEDKDKIALDFSRTLDNAFPKDEQLGNEYLFVTINFAVKKTTRTNIFTMAMLDKPLNGDWQKYYYLDCILGFTISISKGITVTLEIKGASGPPFVTEKYIGTGEPEQIAIKMKDYSKEKWSIVRELCFTVFQVDCKTNSGNFGIINCKLTRDKEKQMTS